MLPKYFSQKKSTALGCRATESHERDFLAHALGHENANNKQTEYSVFLPFNIKKSSGPGLMAQICVFFQLSWFKNGVRIQLSDKYQSTYSNENASLSIKKAKTEDSGHYTLLAENLQGTISLPWIDQTSENFSLSFSRLCCFICLSGDWACRRSRWPAAQEFHGRVSRSAFYCVSLPNAIN